MEPNPPLLQIRTVLLSTHVKSGASGSDLTARLQAALDDVGQTEATPTQAPGGVLVCDLPDGFVVGISDTVYVWSNTRVEWKSTVTLKALATFVRRDVNGHRNEYEPTDPPCSVRSARRS